MCNNKWSKLKNILKCFLFVFLVCNTFFSVHLVPFASKLFCLLFPFHCHFPFLYLHRTMSTGAKIMSALFIFVSRLKLAKFSAKTESFQKRRIITQKCFILMSHSHIVICEKERHFMHHTLDDDVT